ncbi:MAG: toprim domain-containing protein [Desulfamplus sp.]|nr:toprim domain-containing protein [Desulfamplus sp.]
MKNSNFCVKSQDVIDHIENNCLQIPISPPPVSTTPLYNYSPVKYPDIQTIRDHLNNSLPPFESLTALKNHATGKLCGACPLCGSDDRFYLNIKEQRGYCTHCEERGGDLIDWHMKIKGYTHPSDLLNDYPIHQESVPGKTVADVQRRWNSIVKNNNVDDIHKLFVSRRNLSVETVNKAYAAGKIRAATHISKSCVAVPFLSLQGENFLYALQFITIDGEPFQFGDNAKNKIFQKGSNHDDGFFQARTEIEQASIVVIVEGMIDALTVAEIVPDVCCLATGSTAYTKKISHLKPHLEHLSKVIVCQDNDEAGTGFIKKVAGILQDKVFHVQWMESDPKGLDVNDLLKSGQVERIRQMIDGAVGQDRKQNRE